MTDRADDTGMLQATNADRQTDRQTDRYRDTHTHRLCVRVCNLDTVDSKHTLRNSGSHYVAQNRLVASLIHPTRHAALLRLAPERCGSRGNGRQ